LVYDNECLVIQERGYFYVADSFQRTKYAFKEHIYTDVVIDDYPLRDRFAESQVFYFELHNERIKDVIDGLYRSYAKLIAASQNHYKKNATRRGALTVPTNYPQTDDAQNDLKELLEKRFKRFFSADGDAVIPLTNGMTYTEAFGERAGTKGALKAGTSGRSSTTYSTLLQSPSRCHHSSSKATWPTPTRRLITS